MAYLLGLLSRQVPSVQELIDLMRLALDEPDNVLKHIYALEQKASVGHCDPPDGCQCTDNYVYVYSMYIYIYLLVLSREWMGMGELDYC